jgi:hypothetical protein
MMSTGVGLKWQEHSREYEFETVGVEMYFYYLCYAFVSVSYRHTNTCILRKLNFGCTRAKVLHL